jgi:preprotein translocase subunit SecE
MAEKVEFRYMELSKAGSWPEQTRSYLEEVKAEMRRVSWPTWPQVRATTGVVIAAVFLFAAYFAVVDAVCNSVITKLLNSLK